MKCPFTQEDVNKIDPQALAITYNFEQEQPKCGHESRLRSLISYLHTGNSASNNKCPCCCLKITDVYDGVSNDVMLSKSENVSAYDLISFKYAAHNFHLAVSPKDIRQQSQMQLFQSYIMTLLGHQGSSNLAQDRIANVLDMEESNMKILFKGRVLFPIKIKDKSMTPQGLSRKLIEISITDMQSFGGGKKKPKHPSLVVMGTPRKEMVEAQRYIGAGHLRHKNTWRSKVTHFAYMGTLKFVGLVKTIVGATFLMFKTILPSGHIGSDDSNR